MVATKDYADYVKTAAHAGADVIISGAGLPVDLPEYVTGTDTKIAPIVSSEKAARIILKMWDRRYKRTADFVVIEGAHAGGHLGFSREELTHLYEPDYEANYDDAGSSPASMSMVRNMVSIFRLSLPEAS